MVGGLRYLVHTRPDILYVVGIVSHYLEQPNFLHQNAVKRILRYIKGTLDYGLIYSKQGGNNILTGYSNNDLAGNLDDMRSTGGMVFYLNESMISWMFQKQKICSFVLLRGRIHGCYSSCLSRYVASKCFKPGDE